MIKCRKSAIQFQHICLACKAHANAKNQPLVADSIEFKEPIYVKLFVNAKENPINYTSKKDNGTDNVDTAAKKIEEERVSHQVKFQTHEYQKALMFIQTLWNMVYGQRSESFQLALIERVLN